MKIHDLSPAPGSTHRKKRVGRGPGSGHGKTSTKGHKGQHARSGGVKPPGFEGGQMPLVLRIPKRGFTPLNRDNVVIYNLSRLEEYSFPDNKVSYETLADLGILKGKFDRVKILGNGEVSKAYIIEDLEVSVSAKEKIESAGGQVVSTLISQ
ncbi:50S ribosomal protein L15 [Leptospirillum ferrooxidans]|jgi:large subunit ribosomal protein L15|uniref:Large ribosomal subunit protein uL15 n=1 Tax=Leptospirillum ferrooxidans (strain C2-3) TaxID=1162668 RepID=I0IMV6_LEPFC|nr:50S ribosomal protein L15 [Leptospirillum ferrooxidans]BAM06605.1 ribosomal protein L15 [Leptospirillum ferrooxidans C2-3]